VTITWAPSIDDVATTGYEVLRNDLVIGFTTATSLVDLGVVPDRSYDYRVRARDAAGNWSAQSAALTVTTPALPGSVTFGLGADTTIRSDSPTRNYGSTVSIKVDGSPQRAILLQVDVSGLAGRTVTGAHLLLYCIDPATLGGEFHRVSNPWSESTVTWDTAPAAEPEIVATLGAVTAGFWYSIDLTGAIAAEGTYAFMIVSASANGADYVSREGAPELQPTLVLELAP
jgi:hypothetical protein